MRSQSLDKTISLQRPWFTFLKHPIGLYDDIGALKTSLVIACELITFRLQPIAYIEFD